MSTDYKDFGSRAREASRIKRNLIRDLKKNGESTQIVWGSKDIIRMLKIGVVVRKEFDKDNKRIVLENDAHIIREDEERTAIIFKFTTS